MRAIVASVVAQSIGLFVFFVRSNHSHLQTTHGYGIINNGVNFVRQQLSLKKRTVEPANASFSGVMEQMMPPETVQKGAASSPGPPANAEIRPHNASDPPPADMAQRGDGGAPLRVVIIACVREPPLPNASAEEVPPPSFSPRKCARSRGRDRLRHSGRASP